MGIISKMLGLDNVVEKGLKIIDDFHYSDGEEAEDKRKDRVAKTKAKIDLMNAYAPFKLAQRYLALMFTSVFLFIIINGVLGSLYGWIDIANVHAAKDFANEMWLGEIVIMIVTFYFGGGLVESTRRKKEN